MKYILFDVDGVLTVPEEVFSKQYSKSKGLGGDCKDEHSHAIMTVR